MILTEEMIKDLPLITDEELAAIRVPKKELIRHAVEDFDRELTKDIIEAIDSCNPRIERTIPDISDYISGMSYDNKYFVEKEGIYKETTENDSHRNDTEKFEQTLHLMFGLIIQRTYHLEKEKVLVIAIGKIASKNEVGYIRHFMRRNGYNEFVPPFIHKGQRMLTFEMLKYEG